jgi:signal transduction histidine kinase
MTQRSASGLAWGLWGVSAAACATAVVFLVASRNVPTPTGLFGPRGFSILLSLVLATVGAVVASRQPRNPIGWVFSVAGILGGVQAAAQEYGMWAVLKHGDRGDLAAWALWIVEWTWIPIVGSVGFVFAVFPDGRTLSPRWRAALVVAIAGASLAAVAEALTPDLTTVADIPNPIGIRSEAVVALGNVGLLCFLLMIGLGLLSLVVRFRRSGGDERQQLKWVALAASALLSTLVFFVVVAVIASGGVANEVVGYDWAENLVILGFFAIPVAIGIGVLKYRLYDIDVVINKTVVYGTLGVFITLVYVAVVVGIGTVVGSRGNAVLSAFAAAIVALAFQPARRRAQHLANRLVYGKRATPYEVLSSVSSRFAGTYSIEDALPRLARVTGEAVGAVETRIWLRRDEQLTPAAVWPTGDDVPPVALSDGELSTRSDGAAWFGVRHQGELLGTISVTMPSTEPLSPAQEKLLSDVAAHAGLVLRNVGLVADLRASRQRIVTAQDERARKLERDLHDGAQQQLVALAVKLRLAEQLIESDPEKARTTIAAVRDDATEALETLRDLARGIYPPLLADQGLAVAIESHARKSPVPATVESDGIGRYPQEVEAAVYFCTLEALQNVSKYARANRVALRLSERDGVLRFAVEDDGVGFDPSAARGSGLTNMRDRLEALGGGLTVRSSPGSGTTVIGRVPAAGQVVLA